MFLTIKVRRMWGAKTKNKAVDVWHTKAMLVDPKKTKITIIWKGESEMCKSEKNSKPVELDDPKILCTNEVSESLENAQSSPPSIAPKLTEAQNHLHSKENLEKMEQNLEIMELNPIEALNTITASENLVVAETTGSEAVAICETENSNLELISMEKEPENAMFLRILKKTRSRWYNDKQFAKIVRKMEKGKKLRGKEFDKVYMHIRNYCQYN